MDERLMGLETREKGTELDHGKMAGASWKLGQQSSAFLRRQTTGESPAGKIPSAEAVLLNLEKVLADLEGQERELTKVREEHHGLDMSNSDTSSDEQSIISPVVIGSLKDDEQLLHRIECNGFLQGFLLDQIAPLRHRLSSEKQLQDYLRSRAKEKSKHTDRLECDGGGHEEKERVMGPETQDNKTQQLLMDIDIWGSSSDDEEGDEMDSGKPATEDQAPRIDSESKSQREAESVMFMGLDAITNEDRKMVESSNKPMLQPAYPSTNILDCGGNDKKDEMDMRKSDAYWTTDKSMLKPAGTIGRCSVQGCPDHDEMDPLLAKEMANEAERFASYVRGWEYAWGSRSCGFFTDMTTLSSMQFTHNTPGLNSSPGSAAQTLQIFSIKLAEIAGGLKWPLSVYGLVAVRDFADHNRNLLFSRNRSQAQELKEDDRVLRLMGPSRAIVSTDRVDFEIQLKVKGTGTTKSQDKRLISYVDCYDGGYGPGVSTFSVSNCFCTLEFCVQTVTRTFQATVVDVQVVKDDGSWPFEYGGRFACSPLSGTFVFTDSGVARTINPSSSQIVLLDSKDGAWLKKRCGGYLRMWRQVVSVEMEGRLDVAIEAYSKSGDTASQGQVRFIPKSCGMSHGKCALGGSEVSITVAWSLVATDKGTIAAQGNLFEC